MPRKHATKRPPKHETVHMKVSYRHRGHTHDVEVEVPKTDDPEELVREEAASFVQTLADNDRLEGPLATHEIVRRPDGTKQLKRRGFTAV